MDQSVLRVLKLKGFREAVSAGGPATHGVLNSLKLNNYYQSIEVPKWGFKIGDVLAITYDYSGNIYLGFPGLE